MQTETTKKIRERINVATDITPHLATTLHMLLECIEHPPGTVAGELLETETTVFEYAATKGPDGAGAIAMPDGDRWTLDHDATSLIWKLSSVDAERFLIWSREKRPEAMLTLPIGALPELLAAVDAVLEWNRAGCELRARGEILLRLQRARTAQAAAAHETSDTEPPTVAPRRESASPQAEALPELHQKVLDIIREAAAQMYAGDAGVLALNETLRRLKEITDPPVSFPRHFLDRVAAIVKLKDELSAAYPRAAMLLDGLAGAFGEIDGNAPPAVPPTKTAFILEQMLERIDALIGHARGDGVFEYTRFLIAGLEALRPEFAAIVEAASLSKTSAGRQQIASILRADKLEASAREKPSVALLAAVDALLNRPDGPIGDEDLAPLRNARIAYPATIEERAAALVLRWLQGPPTYSIGSMASGSVTEIENERRWRCDLRRAVHALSADGARTLEVSDLCRYLLNMIPDR